MLWSRILGMESSSDNNDQFDAISSVADVAAGDAAGVILSDDGGCMVVVDVNGVEVSVCCSFL
jgi:hypothetical protein